MYLRNVFLKKSKRERKEGKEGENMRATDNNKLEGVLKVMFEFLSDCDY